jgi:hypothetical protein
MAPDDVDQYRQLIHAGLTNDDTAPMKVAHSIGFFSAEFSTTHRSQILGMLPLVFEMLIAKETFDFSNHLIAKQLQDDGLALMEDVFVPPPLPIEILLLQRKFAGILLICARLSASVDVVTS